MGFETVVMSVTRDVVRHANIDFVNGTMFVSNIAEDESKRILNNLRNYVYTDVIVSECGDEFAYDFV